MTNFEKFKSMAVDELADWLDKYGQSDDAPWATWFNETYCNKCEPIKCKPSYLSSYDRPIDCAYCELEHKCKYFPELEDIPDNKTIIEMWLDEAFEDNTKEN